MPPQFCDYKNKAYNSLHERLLRGTHICFALQSVPLPVNHYKPERCFLCQTASQDRGLLNGCVHQIISN